MSSRDHAELANPFDRSSVSRRWWPSRRHCRDRAAAARLSGLLLAYEPDRVRAQRHAGGQPRFRSRLCRPAQPWPRPPSTASAPMSRRCSSRARRAVLGGLRARRDVLAGCAGMALSMFAVRSARPLPRDRLARLCRHRAPGAAELDQPDARAARHLRHQAAAGDCAARPAGRRVRRSGQHVLSGRRLCAALLPSARPARPLADRRDPHRHPRGRGLGGFARHQLPGLEGIRVRRSARRSQARPAASTRASSARWFRMPSSSPNRSRSLRW